MTDRNEQDPTGGKDIGNDDGKSKEADDSEATVEYARTHPVADPSQNRLRGDRFEPGTILGRYEIISCLDSGGMGIVYRARHTALGKTVALKVVSTMLQTDPRAMDRFLREMQAVGSLDPHLNVLNAYDAGDENGVQFIATELIEGVQLAALIGRIGPLAVSEACKIISQAALALEHLRKHNLVHRDIKPSNLMLTRDGTVKVVDMGLALLRDEQAEQITMTGEAMGSIDYMAPEQWADSHNVDYRSDVYSLGCTFYCLLAGHAPFADQRKGSASRMRAHLDSPFPDIGDLRGDVPDGAVKLLKGMVRKDPSDRQSDLPAISESLEVIASGDLKSLVQRGFEDAEIQKRSFAKPQQRVTPRAAFDSDAATEADRPATNVSPTKAGKHRLGIALLTITAAACLLGGLYYFRPVRSPSMPNQLLSATNDESLVDSEIGPQDPGATLSSDLSTVDTAAESSNSDLTIVPVVDCVGHDARIMDMVFLSESFLASVDDNGALLMFDLSKPDSPAVATSPEGRAFAAVEFDKEN
ncbi:MAG: serine/threonine protein kinase, partial [Rubripirellula sp.]